MQTTDTNNKLRQLPKKDFRLRSTQSERRGKIRYCEGCKIEYRRRYGVARIAKLKTGKRRGLARVA